MKQLLILSGKGGTGKTTLASAFIALAKAQAYADCDVDAPNLHLVTPRQITPQRADYYGLPQAVIHPERCTSCDLCRLNCRFAAIFVQSEYKVNPFACEGCGVCEYCCPAGAITMEPAVAGELMLYADTEQVFSTAQLKMGSGTSGLLVSEVKKQMKAAARADLELAIIDGSPGIGCPVIASLSGVDLVLIVAEPSLSGISDLDRIVTTAQGFGTKIAVCVNKFDTNPEKTRDIELFCQERNLDFLGKIPFDPQVVEAINEGKTIAELESAAGMAVRVVYDQLMDLKNTEGKK